MSASAVLEGFDDPRVFVSATDAEGRTCSMGINVGEVTSAALPSRSTLLHALRAMSHRATLTRGAPGGVSLPDASMARWLVRAHR